jgi:hypothetical protein
MGQSMKFWRSEFSATEVNFVLENLRSMRSVSSDGRVSFTGPGELDSWTAFLISASGFDVRTDALRVKIIRGALFSAELKADFSEADFKEVCYRLRYKYESVDIKAFKVAFPVWNCPPFLGGVKKIEGVTLNFSPSPDTRLFKTILRERGKQRSDRVFRNHFTAGVVDALSKCSICIAHVFASCPEDANERASEALYQLLGLVNLANDVGKHWRISVSAEGTLPVSDVLIGPHTSTHDTKGNLTHRGFWRERWKRTPNVPSLNNRNIDIWSKRFIQLYDGLQNSHWKSSSKKALVRYFKAFSNPDLGEAFLDGWRLMENVSGSKNEAASLKIKRIANVFEDDIEKRIITKHLYLRRNLISHGHPIKNDDEETLAFQMLQIVIPYLELYILNGFSFKSEQDFWKFLDLPSSKEERTDRQRDLEHQLALLEKAAYFRGEKQNL